MIKKNWKTILKIIFYCLVSVFLIHVCEYWTSIPRTEPRVAKGIYIFVRVLIGIFVLDIFRNKILRIIKQGLIIFNMILIVSVNVWLADWYLDVQSAEKQVLFYSSYFQPNGDLALMQMLLEKENVVINTDEEIYYKLFTKLSDEVIRKDLNVDEITSKYVFEDLGQLRGLYVVYSSLFDLDYDESTEVPHLYVSSNGNVEEGKTVALSDAQGNIYILKEK